MGSGRLGKTWGNCLDKGPYLFFFLQSSNAVSSLDSVVKIEQLQP
jgi:hypothetical protein